MENFIFNRISGVPISIYDPFNRKQAMFDYIKHPVILEMFYEREKHFTIIKDVDDKFFLLDGSDFAKSDIVIINNAEPKPLPDVNPKAEWLFNPGLYPLPHLFEKGRTLSYCGKARIEQRDFFAIDTSRYCKLCVKSFLLQRSFGRC